MLEKKRLPRTTNGSHQCEMPGCDAISQSHSTGPRSATTALYAAGYLIGFYCDRHERVMRSAWLTDEALLSQRTKAAKATVAYPVAA